jgi:TolB protein
MNWSRVIVIVLAGFLVVACGAGSPPASPTGSVVAVAAPTSAPTSASAPPSAAVSEGPALPGRIVFARRNAHNDFEVFVVDATGSGERRVGDGSHEIPRWSPDGSHISMTAEARGLVTTAIVDADGSGLRVLDPPDATLSLGCAARSPDGSRLACEGWDDQDTKRNGVYTIRVSDGGDLVRISTSPDGGHDIPGSYSPDGSQISFVRSTVEDHGSLFVVPSTGGDARALGSGDTFSSAWSPDGRSILTDGSADTLSRVAVSDGTVEPIHVPTTAGVPKFTFGGRWSPDGDWIVFSMAPAGASNADIYVMRADGSDLRRLTDDPGQEEFADWAP